MKSASKEAYDAAKNYGLTSTGIDQFVESQQQAIEEGQRGTKGAGIKGVFSGIGQRFGNMILDAGLGVATGVILDKVIGSAIDSWDSYSHSQENAINTADEVLSEHKQNIENFSSATKTIDDVGDRFVELQKGVKNGQNMSLSTSDYEEYLNLAKQISAVMPDLASGYDTLGNPIISSINNIKDLNSALAEQQTLTSNKNILNAKKYAEAFNAKNNQIVSNSTKEAGYAQQLELLNKLQQTDLDSLFPDTITNADRRALRGNGRGRKHDSISGRPNFIGNPTRDSSSDILSKVEMDTLKQIYKEAGIDEAVTAKSIADNMQTLMEYSKEVSQLQEQAVNDYIKPLMESSLTSTADRTDKFNSLMDSTKNSLSSMINGMDYDAARALGFVDEKGDFDISSIKDWGKDIVNGLNRSGAEQALQDLMNLDSEKGSMTLAEYEAAYSNLANTVSSKVPQLSRGLLDTATGFEQTAKDLNSYKKDLSEAGVEPEFLDALSNDDLEKIWTLSAEDNFSPVIADIKRQLSEVDREARRLEEFRGTEKYDDWIAAQSTENQGAKYDSIRSGLETAKKAYDEGLTGTDDFKSFAALISPTGSRDAVNFLENYGKAARYLTEDKSGVNNFLSDLSTRLTDSGEAMASFDKSSGKWAFNIQDMSDAADKMGISTEFMNAMFGKAQEYGIDNNFVATRQEGLERINNLQKDLASSERELAEMLKPGEYETTGGMTQGNQTAIDQKRQEVNDLKEAIRGTKEYMDDMTNTWAKDSLDQRNAAKSMIDTLANERSKIMNDKSLSADERDYLKQDLESQIKELADEYDIELTGDLHVEGRGTEELEQIKAEAMAAQEVLNEATGKEYDFNFDSTSVEDLNSQIDTANQALAQFRNEDGSINFDTKGAQEALTIVETLVRQREQLFSEESTPILSAETDTSKVAEGLMGKGEGGERHQAERAAMVAKAAQDFISAKNDFDTAQQMNLIGANNDMESYTANATEAADALQRIVGQEGFEGIKDKLDFSSLDGLEQSLQSLTPEELESVGIKLKADTSEANSQIQSLEGSSVTINASVSGEENVSELSEQLASLPPNEQATVNVSVTGKEDVSNLKSSLENIPDNTPATVNCTVSNQEELDSIRDKVSELNSSGKEITLNATIGTVDTSNIDSATSSVESLENKSVSVTFTVTGQADVETAKTALEALEDKEISLSIDGGDSSQITSIKTALEGLRDENVNISVNISGQSDAESLQKAIETLESKDISVSVSADGAGEVTSLKTSISGLVDKSISISVAASGTDMVTALESAIDSVQGKDVSVTATVNGTSDVLALKSAIDSVHSKSVTVSATTTGTGGVQALAGAIASVHSKTVSIHANYSSSGSLGGGVAFNGTAHAEGTIPTLSSRALSVGSLEEDARFQATMNTHPEWKTKQDQIALTGELGEELVVHGNRFFTVGEKGAEFSHIPAGSIVFNHKQTEELLSKGVTKSHGGRGKVKGNLNIPSNIAHASGTAYAEGSESKWKNSIDWIERLVESLEYVYTAHQDSSELAVSLSKKNKFLDKAIADNQELIKANQKGDRYYYDKAVSVGLSKELRDKARTGDIKIEDYDEGTQQKIKDYQEMLDKSRKCREAVRDLQKEQKKLVEQKFDNLLDRYDALQGVISGQQGVQEARQKYYEASGHGGNKMVRESVQEQLKYQNQMTKSLTAQKDEYKALMKQAKKAYGTNSNEYKEAAAQYYKLKEGIWESRAEAAKLTETLREIEYTKLQNVIDRWGRASDRWSTYGDYYGVDKRLSPDERRTKQQTAYQKEINANNKQIVALDALLKKKQEYLLSMHFNDKAYTETAEEVKNLQQEIVNLGITNEELRDKIRASRWEAALANLENLKNQLTEIEDIRGMLNQDGLINKEDASLSKDGYANLALIREGMSKNLQLIANYTTLMGKLDEELKNGNISQEDYNTEMQEFSQGIRDAAKNNKQYKDSLIDMYTTQLDYANEALQKNIDKRREALEAKKDYYDYDRNIKKQTKDIRSLQAQIAALEGTTNAADRARLAKLREELADTQDNLDDDLYSHKIELELSGYDELKNSANEALDATLNYLKTNTDAQKQVVDSMLKSLEGSVTDSLGNVTSGYESAMSRIQQLVSDTAIVTSQAFKDNFKDIFDIIDNQLGLNGTTSDDTTNGTDTSPIPGTNGPAQDIVDNIVKGDGDGTKLKSVKLSETSIKLVEGESKKLVVTALPENASNRVMTWATNSPSCVGITVPKGADTLTRIIVAKKSTGRGGSATVTVTPNDVGQKPITCKVKIITQTAAILEKKEGKGASNDGLSQVNQVLAKFNYGQASKEQMLQFAKDYKVSGATMDNITSKKIQTELAAKLERRFVKDNIYNAIKALPDENRDSKAIASLSELSKHVSKTHGKRLTQTGAVNLAELAGLHFPGDYESWTTFHKNELLRTLKFYGFSSGGSVRKGRIIPTSEMSKIFKEAAINNGDDGWASVNLDEHIFNNDQLQSVISAAQSQLLDSISGSYLANAQNMPAINDTSVVYHYDSLLNVQGDVTKEVLPDLQTILKESYKYTVKQQTKDFTKKKRR